jgi:sugar phosphate permease
LISSWYINREQQSRLAAFYLLATLISAFNPIICYGISTIGEAYGLKAWRWIFIIFGSITAALGIIAYWIIADFPDKATFLTPDEIKLVRDRIDADRGDATPDSLTWKKTMTYILDWKLWSFAVMYSSSTLVPYAFSSFMPVILRHSLGFSFRDAQLLNTPPSVFTVIAGLIVAHYADKSGVRGPWIVGQAACTIIGLAVMGFAHNNALRYAASFLALFGGLSNIPAILAYSMNNITGSSKRSYTSALVSAFGGVGGIVAGASFREQDTPKYVPGIWTAIAFQVMTIILVICTSTYFAYRNRQVRRGDGPPIEGVPGFFYTL